MFNLQLNDGSNYNISMCGASEGILWIELHHMTMMDAVTTFSDSAKTVKMVAYGTVTHENYTQLIHVSLNFEGLVKVALKKHQS